MKYFSNACSIPVSALLFLHQIRRKATITEIMGFKNRVYGKILIAIVLETKSHLISIFSVLFLKSKIHQSKHKALKIKVLVFFLHLEWESMPSKLTGSPPLNTISNNCPIAQAIASSCNEVAHH